MEKFSVVFHPCETLDNYTNNTYSYSPLYTHHFFNLQENWSAVQWVKYDVYYIVDTFELFIKVSGQLYMSKDDNDIRKGLYLIYKSVFSTLPECTLVLDELHFTNMLYLRSNGSKNYLPPGRIMIEIPLNDSCLFQLRYCLFNEKSNTYNNLNNGHLSSRYDKKSNLDGNNKRDMVDKSIYFKYSMDKDSLDIDIYDECYMNISHKGNFDYCLIYDMINLLNKNKTNKLKSPRKHSSLSTFDRLDYSVQDNFNILHRRLEWFYHWFIEGASNIVTDSRWSVFIPLIVHDYKSSGQSHINSYNHSKQNHFLNNFNNYNHNTNHNNHNLSKNNNHNNHNNNRKYARQLENGKNSHNNDHSYTSQNTQNSISNALTSNEEFDRSVFNKGDRTKQEDSLRNTILNEPIGVISGVFEFKNKKSPRSSKSNQYNNNRYNITILGMVTAYYFFTLNNDRLRISQFMIFPNYNGKGFGLWVLEMIYRFGIMDCNVREITVEDPTPAFLVLRYVVALKLCFESKLVNSNVLYPNKSSLGFLKLFSKEYNIPSRDHISSICKESKSHSTRLVEILQLASILPNPVSTEFFVSMLSNKRPKMNNLDVKMSIFIQSDLYLDYWDKLRNRLKEDELKSSGKSTNLNKLSPNKYMNSVSIHIKQYNIQMDAYLDNMCIQTISGYIRVINKLRKMFPKI